MKKEIEKNKIDLQYRYKGHEANVYLTLATITSVGLVAYLIVSGYFEFAVISGLFIITFAIVKYRKIKREMGELLDRLK